MASTRWRGPSLSSASESRDSSWAEVRSVDSDPMAQYRLMASRERIRLLDSPGPYGARVPWRGARSQGFTLGYFRRLPTGAIQIELVSSLCFPRHLKTVLSW